MIILAFISNEYNCTDETIKGSNISLCFVIKVLAHESNSCIFKSYIYAYYHRGNKQNKGFRDLVFKGGLKLIQYFDSFQQLIEQKWITRLKLTGGLSDSKTGFMLFVSFTRI